MKVYAPNVHLFAFQLYKNSNNPSVDKNFIWQTGDEIVDKTLHQDLHLYQRIDVNKEPDNPRVDLLKDTEVINDNYAISFAGKVPLNQTQDVLIKGFAHPLRIYDSYSLWLNLRRPEQENDQPTSDVDITFLSRFNQNNCLTFKEHPLFLGQTLLITAWLTGAKDKKVIKQIADECLTAIFPDSQKQLPFNRQGELFGSPIFEYGLFSQISNYQHVLIWLFADEQPDIKFNQCYQELLDLFFFHTKVVKAYKDSREIYKQLDAAYLQIEAEIDKVPKVGEQKSIDIANLTGLKNQLKALPQLALTYTRLLRNLEEYQNTIAINAYNYDERLQKIHAITGEDINFLETFSQKNCPYFQQQINADLGYFRHGSELLGRAVDSIRGIVEIEQAERDRSLESTIQILGIGFGGGAIASGVFTTHIDKINLPLIQKHPLYASLTLSIIATLIFIALGWLITKRK
ncbi:hypothetical protein LC613_00925 [Nostoc sphaeroides CHAB 2801]|uniref:hypothetical protein n=1 Tax=Nostoc sphaeroides TaxID=446679 RepID=UPI000E4B9272|nr:hypothetical protein [Nostoc sphaeroides]MCC5626828.1 hypothetical protein [Nostoc sphaeroides CHAB 2801]